MKDNDDNETHNFFVYLIESFLHNQIRMKWIIQNDYETKTLNTKQLKH